jgi:hypothetical protein
MAGTGELAIHPDPKSVLALLNRDNAHAKPMHRRDDRS